VLFADFAVKRAHEPCHPVNQEEKQDGKDDYYYYKAEDVTAVIEALATPNMSLSLASWIHSSINMEA
jgi:hypothetical protein